MGTETRLGDRAHVGAGGNLASDGLVSMVLDRIADGVLLSDSSGVIVYANKPLLRLFGYDNSSDLVGKLVEVLLPDYLHTQHRHHVTRFFTSPEPRPMGRDDLDIEGRRADGSLFSIDVELNALPDTSLVVATVRDMTAQRSSSVDNAISRIDLANSRARVEQLQTALDLVIQRLFALGISITAGASSDAMLAERMAAAVHRIDEIIEAVQQSRAPGR